MSKIDQKYHKLTNKVLNEGFVYEDPNRKGVKRVQIPSYELRYDFKHGFPAITTKQLYWKGVVGELIWFLRGDTDIKYLVDNDINIWNKDAYNYYLKLVNDRHKTYSQLEWLNLIKNRDITNFGFEGVGSPYAKGPLGRVYGAQWRNWSGIRENSDGTMRSIGYDERYRVDQFQNLIKGLKETPMGTKHMVTAWNPAELDEMALPPCHWSFEILVEPYSPKPVFGKGTEFYYANDPLYQFTLKWHQRSVDTFLGLPFNIASYALLAYIIGKMTNMVPKGIIGDLSNVHIYEPHLKAVERQLDNSTKTHGSSKLFINETTERVLAGEKKLNEKLDFINISDFELKDYSSYGPIKAQMIPYTN